MMFRKRRLALLPVSVFLLAAADQTWKDKPVANWSEDEAQDVLADSPWTKNVKPTINRSASNTQQSSGGYGRGIGMGGIGMGIPGMGGGGMGRHGGYPGGHSGGQRPPNEGAYNEPTTLKLRWESALPVREAELKARETDAPTLDSDHYAIAIYGVPNRILTGNSLQSIQDHLKKQAAIKRDGKKDMKPSSVEVLQRENGPVIVYLFPRSNEITKQDRRLEFEGQIGNLQVSESFFIDDMNYMGKLEL
jgi:hypothetical protein